MHQLLKKGMSVFLAFILTFSLIGTSVFAENEIDETTASSEAEITEESTNHRIDVDEEEQKFTLPDDGKEYSYWINPSIENEYSVTNVIESVEEDRNAPSTLSYSASVRGEEAAIEQLKIGLMRRETPITINFTREGDALMSQWFIQATAHTGDPEEGDYLYHNVASYAVATDWKNDTKATITFYVNYFSTVAQETETVKEANALLKQLGVLKLDPTDYYERYEIVKTIYDWVCNNVCYDYNRLAETSADAKSWEQQTAYGALVNRTAVCEGYSNLIYMLLLMSGVDCRMIDGTSSTGNHVWNLVDMSLVYDSFTPGNNGVWYYLDATWSAAGYNSFGGYHDMNYDYFLEGSYTFDQNHSQFSFSGPLSDGTVDYYIDYYDYDTWDYDYWVSENRCYEFDWSSNYNSCVAKYGTNIPSYNCTVKQVSSQYQARTITLNYNTGYYGNNGTYTNLLSSYVVDQIIELQDLGYFPRFKFCLGCYMPDDNTVRVNVGAGIRWYDSLMTGNYSLNDFLASGIDMIFISSKYVDNSQYELTSDQIAYFRSKGINVIDMESLLTDSRAWSYLYHSYDMSEVLNSDKAGFFNYEGFWVALLYHQYVDNIPQSVLDDLGITWIATDTVCDHDFGTPTWHWADDGLSCRASCVCKYCGYETTVNAVVSAVGSVTEPTCITDGKGTYQATTVSGVGGLKGGSVVYTSNATTWTKKAHGHPMGSVLFTFHANDGAFIELNKNGEYELSCDSVTIECDECGTSKTYNLNSSNWSYLTYGGYLTEPTCTNDGSFKAKILMDLSSYDFLMQYAECDVTFDIPATGHTWGSDSWSWNDSLTSCTYRRQCSVCGESESKVCTLETFVLKPATCTENGTEWLVAYCTTDDGLFHYTYKEVSLYRLGHLANGERFDWSNDYETCKYIVYCTRCSKQLEEHTCRVTSEVTIEPTCDTQGERQYTAIYIDADVIPHVDVKLATIPATGHNYGIAQLSAVFNPTDGVAMISMFCTDCDEEEAIEAPVTYNVVYNSDGTGIMTMSTIIEINGELVTLTSEEYDMDDVETVHNWVLEDSRDATCTEEGDASYVCADCGETMSVTIEAPGHEWNEPAFEWSDDYAECTAVFTCANCDETEAVSCDITVTETDDSIVYTAVAVMDGEAYTDEVTIDKGTVVVGAKNNNDGNTNNSSKAGTAETTNETTVGDTLASINTKAKSTENSNNTNEVTVATSADMRTNSSGSGVSVATSNDGAQSGGTVSSEGAKTGDNIVMFCMMGAILALLCCCAVLTMRRSWKYSKGIDTDKKK